MHERNVELFEPNKILGDVFEAVMAAVFVDGGGIETVL
jgi:dsRNA-specific ribonuclease